MILEAALPIPLFKTFDYLVPSRYSDEREADFIGRRVRVPFGFKSAIGLVCGIKNASDTPAEKLKILTEFIDEEPILNPELMNLGRWLSIRTACSLGEALFALLPPGKPFRSQIDENSDQHTCLEDDGTAYHIEPQFITNPSKPLSTIHNAVHSGVASTFAARELSDQDQWELIAAATRDVLSQRKTVLILGPEIAYANRISSALKSVFGEKEVCVWHGDRSMKSRVEDWRRIRRSEFSIVVGTRSASLLPLAHLGLIVLTQEHEGAYKEERKPRYHARDICMERARQNKSLVLLFSPAPSMRTAREIKDKKIRWLEIRSDNSSVHVPPIRLVDMDTQKKRGGISLEMEKSLSSCLKEKSRAILFLNRRGFLRSFRCSDCSWIPKCTHCAVPLVLHKEEVLDRKHASQTSKEKRKKMVSEGILRCHLCHRALDAPHRCPQCGGKLKAFGSGTQRIAEEIREKFPWAQICRWDADSLRARKGGKRLTDRVASGNFDILVGTQLVTQSFLLPRVHFVGVVDADVPLHVPDYRAAEKTYSILAQLNARLRQDTVGGEMLVQTRNPDHYAIQCAVKSDYAAFSEMELAFREELNYPPFSHLILIRSSSVKGSNGEEELNRMSEWVRENDPSGQIGILGPYNSRRQAGRKKSDFQVLLKIPEESFFQFLTNLHGFLESQTGRFWIDVDPENLN